MPELIRKAFLMKLRPGSEHEYRKRHDPIWPELHATLKEHGVHNYSIFLESNSGNLFAYVEIESESAWEKIAETEVCRRWWKSMSELMLTNADDSPQSIALREVFHID